LHLFVERKTFDKFECLWVFLNFSNLFWLTSKQRIIINKRWKTHFASVFFACQYLVQPQ